MSEFLYDKTHITRPNNRPSYLLIKGPSLTVAVTESLGSDLLLRCPIRQSLHRQRSHLMVHHDFGQSSEAPYWFNDLQQNRPSEFLYNSHYSS